MGSTPEMPPTLNDAIATEPLWLQVWVMLLIATHLGALLFIFSRRSGRWAIHPEPIAIIVSFIAAAVLMGRIYDQVGYVRLLGLAHLACWGPVWIWVFSRRSLVGTGTAVGRYVHIYLLVAGASLIVDALDVARYMVGDGALLGR